MAEDTPSSDFYWDNVVFKVEDKLFCVPRCGFVQSSEVFADMFLLPSRPGNTEGQNKEHPIILEGYKKDEFSSLLKVMYPIAGSLISGTTLDWCLGKEEWLNVLKLSTIWNMEKIRKYAIHKLSTDFVLSPFEKIHLGRAYKVFAWLHQGISGLLDGNPKLTLDDFATLGWENAARILWIMRNYSLFLSPAFDLYFKKDEVKCGYCASSSSLLNFPHNCHICGQLVPADAELTVPGPGPGAIVQLNTIQCGYINCRGATFSSINVPCSSCSACHSPHHKVKITPKKGLEEMIEEIFGEEICNSDGA